MGEYEVLSWQLLRVVICCSIISFIVPPIEASMGDQSVYFQSCVNDLYNTVCNNITRVIEMKQVQSLPLRLTMWSCQDECKYHCMWVTVKHFLTHFEQVPQFYGKWPFIRFMGMQEPASAIFSLLNGISFFFVFQKFRSKVHKDAPTYYVWSGYAVVNINAWLWSTVFHTRDTVITEMLDYFCATSGVLYSFFGLCARVLYKWPKIWLWLCAIFCCTLFIAHVHYLAFVHFDYGYNMKASVTVGFVNSVGWLAWSAMNWKRMPHVKKCVAVVLLVNVFLFLELLDFPPIWWIFDAHSLWHLGTIPLPILWFSFVIEDCNYMLKDIEKNKFY